MFASITYALMLLVPLWAVIRLRGWGILLAALYLWILFTFIDYATVAVGQESDGWGAALSYAIMLRFGWLAGLVVAALGYGVGLLLQFLWRAFFEDALAAKRAKNPSQPRRTFLGLHPAELIGLALAGAHLLTIIALALSAMYR